MTRLAMCSSPIETCLFAIRIFASIVVFVQGAIPGHLLVSRARFPRARTTVDEIMQILADDLKGLCSRLKVMSLLPWCRSRSTWKARSLLGHSTQVR